MALPTTNLFGNAGNPAFQPPSGPVALGVALDQNFAACAPLINTTNYPASSSAALAFAAVATGNGAANWDLTNISATGRASIGYYAVLNGAASATNTVSVGSGLLGGGTLSSNPVISLGTELLGLSALSANGYVYRSGAGTYTSSTSIPGSVVSGSIPGNAQNVNGVVAVANGGTGTATPSLVAGDYVTITGSWPNQTITVSETHGTVTSIGVSGGTTGLTTSGGPVTASGVITLGGLLATGYGGTGLTTFTANGALYAASTSVLTTGTLPVNAGGTGVTTSTGSGNNVLSTSPTLVTPALGTPTALVLTNATGLPLTTGVTGLLPVSSGGTGVGTLTGYVYGNGTSVMSASTTIPGTAISGNISGNAANVTGTVGVGNGGTGLTATPTNGQLDIGNGSGFTRATLTQGSNIAITNGAGSITVALATSPTLVTPALGVATATSINGLTINTTTGTLALVNGSTLATSGANSLTLVTTGTTSVTLPTSGTLVNSAVTALSSLASVGTIGTGVWQGTTVATGYGGTGLTTFTANGALYATSTSALTTGTLPVNAGGTGVTTSTGTGNVVLSTSPTLVTPALGTPSALVLTNATGLPLTTGVTGLLPVSYGGTGIGTLTGYVYGNGTSAMSASTTIPGSAISGNISGNAANVTGTVGVGNGGTGLTATPINGQLDIGNGSGFTRTTLTQGSNIAITNGSGSISIALATSPTLVTPALGVATATSINGLTINTTTGTLGIANGSTLATSGAYSVTLTTTGATNVTLPTSGTLANTAVTTLSSLSSVGTIGTGVWQGSTVAVGYGGTGITSFGTGVATALGNNVTGSGGIVLATSPMLVTPVLGSASATSVAMTSGSVNNAPVSSTDIANKAYVDAAVAGISVKTSCQEATTAALPSNAYNNGTSGVGATLTGTATGVLTVDGVTVALNDRILVKNEATAANNGIYVCTTAGAVGTAYALTRSTDSNSSVGLMGGFTFIEKGTVNASTGWANTNMSTITVGTTAINYSQFSGAGTYTAGTGLTLTGSQFSISATTVSAGTYNLGNFTVNAQGQITAASAPTTTGSGSVVLATSPSLVTPSLGVATATSLNGLTVTSTTGTLTLANGSTLATSGANSITLTTTGSTSLTLPTTGTVTALGNTTTGSGSTLVLATSPSLVTPSLGVATATSLNGLTVTSTTGTLTLANGSTLATSGANSITLTSTGTTNVTLPTSGTLVNSSVATLSSLTSVGTLTTGVWNATTIAVANGGTGVTTSTGPTSVVLRDANANITSNGLFEGFTNIAGAGGTTSLTASSTPNYIVTGSSGQTYVLPNATTLPVGAIFTFNNNTSTSLTINYYGGALLDTITSGGYATYTLLTNGTTAGTWDKHYVAPSNVSWSTNTLAFGGAITSAAWQAQTIGVSYGGTGVTTSTGSGSNVLSTSPTLVTPALGVATGTSLALGGATIGSNALAVTGSTNLIGALTVAPASGAASGAIKAVSGQIASLSVAGNGTTVGTSDLYLAQDGSSIGYLYNKSNAALLFGTNNAERMRILSSGTVVINGTSAIQADLLSVYGRASIQSNDPYTLYLRYNSSTNGVFIGGTSSSAFQVSAAGGAQLFVVNASGQAANSGYAPVSTAGISGFSTTTYRSSASITWSRSDGYQCGGLLTCDAQNYQLGAATAMVVGYTTESGRSINCGGTVNTSGADYAEYITKADGCSVISAGDIAGIDSDGKLTSSFSSAHTFFIKSTNPSFVGGDNWGTEDILGPKPEDGTPEYDTWWANCQAVRAKVDRIAIAGRVPVNILGAAVGDYIVPIDNGSGGITGQPVTNPTFDQYRMAVGKVLNIQADGRAFICVKIG